MVRRFLSLISLLGLAWLGACSSSDSPEGAATALPDTTAPPSIAEIVEAQSQIRLKGQAGRWTKVRQAGSPENLTEEQRQQIRRLESLGYVGGTQLAPTMKNVTVHDPDRAWSGLNLFTSGHAPVALLMDMDGQVLHRWGLGYWRVWPDSEVDRGHDGTMHWRRARILPGGDLLAIFEGLGIVKIDRHSNLIWANHCRAHHDLEVLPDGDIIVLAREARLIPRLHPRTPVLEDFILRLGPDGEIKQRVSLLEAFENSEEWRHLLDRLRTAAGDIFHTNSVEWLDGRHAEHHPEFTAGRVLISMRETHTVAVVDLEHGEVMWVLQDDFRSQHDATMLDSGQLMLFNNDYKPGMSSVDRYDPATGERVWRFTGTSERPFYSRTCSTSQPLPNGNILVTESDNGRVFEIDTAEDTVWEFYNPNRTGEANEYIATLFEVLRLPADYPVDWAVTPR